MLFIGTAEGSGRKVEFGFENVVLCEGWKLIVTDGDGLDVTLDKQSVRPAKLSVALESIDRDMGERNLWQASYKLANGERLEVRRDISPSQAIAPLNIDSITVPRRWCKICQRTTAHDDHLGRCLRCAGLWTETHI